MGSRETQRLESISRSPIYAHFGESVTGIKTIQAFHRQKKFIAISDELMDVNAAAYMTKTLATEWLNMRLDFVGMLIAGMAAFLAASGGVGVVFTGLILTYALEVPKFLKFGTMMAARVESEFNSVERVVQYLKVDTEADEDTPPEVKKALPATFASKSTLAFRNYSMRYRDGLPRPQRRVLHDRGWRENWHCWPDRFRQELNPRVNFPHGGRFLGFNLAERSRHIHPGTQGPS